MQKGARRGAEGQSQNGSQDRPRDERSKEGYPQNPIAVPNALYALAVLCKLGRL